MAMIRQGPFADEVFEDYRRENEHQARRASDAHAAAQQVQAPYRDPWFAEMANRLARNTTPHHMRRLRIRKQGTLS